MCCALGRAHIEQGSDVVRGELLDLDQISNASVAQRAGAARAATVGRSIHFSCTKRSTKKVRALNNPPQLARLVVGYAPRTAEEIR